MLALFVVYYLASQSLPSYSGNTKLSGLNAPIEIIRSNANVPHIIGENDEDVFFGLGYTHATDRLWQMTLMRRTVQGRLSELFGTDTLEIDSYLRRLDLHNVAREAHEVQSDDAKAALAAYARGVNARIEEINKNALGRGAPEFFLFNSTIAPWQPSDSLALLKLMSVQLSSHMQNEILYAKTSLILGNEARVQDILPNIPGTALTDLPDYASILGGKPQFQTASVQANPHRLDPRPTPGLEGASNAWSAMPFRSAAGGTLLANDPHLELTAPTIWYLARMELQSGGVIGGTIPGIPLILTGRSAKLGWGLTSSYLDDQDIFLEELNPENPTQYRTADGYKPFRSRDSIVHIKDSAPVTLKLRWSDNGPIMGSTTRDIGAVTPTGHVAALGFVALEPNDTSYSAGLKLMQSHTVQEALEAVNDYVAPSQNLSLIDAENIALTTIGRMPKRDAAHVTQGRMPSLGWMPQNQWQGYFDTSVNPRFFDPESGILGNTNNKVIDRPFPEHLSFRWGDSQRIQRWKRLIELRQVHTRESFMETQLDTVSQAARTLLPLVGADLWFTGTAADENTSEGRRNTALRMLSEWNGEMNEHMPEPLIYAAWMRALQDRMIRDELGPLADDYKHVEPLFVEKVFRNVDGAGAWCDVVQSAPIETCPQLAKMALDDALLWISNNHPGRLSSLRWGDAHEATHDHTVLGEVPFIRYFVNIRQSTSGGDQTLQRGKTSGEDPTPFHNVHGAGYRGIYDFADPDSSVFITSTGQSGHFLSRYYDNLGQLWRRGEYIPMSLDLRLARGASVGTLTIAPKTPANP
jgi:penicillin amidase